MTLDEAVLEALAGYDSPTISNAIERFKVRDRTEGYTSSEVHSMFPELPPMVGYAVTCTAETAPPADGLPGFDTLLDLIGSAPKPVVLVMGWSGDDRSRGCVLGEMTATGLARIGVVGIVTDSAIRDRAGIHVRAPKLQVFARGAVASHGCTRLVRIGEPTVVGGLRIDTGALLHGDENGLVEVPRQIAHLLPEVAQSVRNDETDYFDAVTRDDAGFVEVRSRLVGYR